LKNIGVGDSVLPFDLKETTLLGHPIRRPVIKVRPTRALISIVYNSIKWPPPFSGHFPKGGRLIGAELYSTFKGNKKDFISVGVENK